MFTELINRIIDARIEASHIEAEEQMRKIVSSKCREMVFDLFSSSQEFEAVAWQGARKATIALLKEGIATRVALDLERAVKKETKDYIYGEAFIDTVIARIRSKQLG